MVFLRSQPSFPKSSCQDSTSLRNLPAKPNMHHVIVFLYSQPHKSLFKLHPPKVHMQFVSHCLGGHSRTQSLPSSVGRSATSKNTPGMDALGPTSTYPDSDTNIFVVRKRHLLVSDVSPAVVRMAFSDPNPACMPCSKQLGHR